MNCFVGVDVGTTNVKALALLPSDLNTILAHASASVDTINSEPGYAEQDVTAIWDALVSVMADLNRQLTEAGHTASHVAFSTAMHSLLAMDNAGEPMSHAILWSDNRAEEQATALRTSQKALGDAIYQQTGTPIHPMIPLCKLAWLQQHDPRLLHRAAHFGSIKEYLWRRLTGQFEIDFSIATATGLFDPAKQQWSKDAITYAGVRPDQLSAAVPTTQQRPLQSNDDTAALGFSGSVTLVIGASDGCLANLGAGGIKPGVTTLTIGTSGAIRQTVSEPLRDPDGRLFCYWLDKDHYVVGGPTNNGGNVLEWVEQLVQQQTEAVLSAAETVPPGADGLLFLPYLQGERAPLWNSAARGAYLNIDFQHTQAHFARAALEGVLFNLLSINQLLTRQIGPSRVIHANGGFAQSRFWVQMLADMSGIPVRLNASNESGSMGGILLIMKAVGLVKSLDEAAGRVSFGDTIQPDQSRSRVYQQVFRNWEKARTQLLGG